MSEGLLPSKASAKFLDYIGLGLILMPIEQLGQRWIADQPISTHQWIAVFAFLIAGAISLALGTWWDKVNPMPSGRLAASFDAVAHNAITWLVVAAVIVFGVPTAMGLISSPMVPEIIGLIIAVSIMALLAAIFRPDIHGHRQPLSHQELDYRTQQRKFILSNLYEMLTTYLSVMSIIGDNCGRVVGNGSASQMHWFANYALDRGIRRQYVELHEAATNDFVNISTEAINNDILQFLLEYQNVSSFPEKIERLADLGKTSRDNWDAAHQRCRSALLDLKASSFSGILTESTAMETLQTMPKTNS